MNSSKSKVGFIHVTKTGGVDFRTRAPEGVYANIGHKETAKTYAQEGIPCFGIMRDPIDRFVSAYCFSKLGSDTYTMNAKCANINEFIDNNFKTSRCHQILFKPQMSWFVDGDPKNTYILKYTNDNNPSIIQLLNQVFGININYDTSTPKVNVSKREDCTITEENMAYLLDYYKEDIKIFSKLNKPYMKLDELL